MLFRSQRGGKHQAEIVRGFLQADQGRQSLVAIGVLQRMAGLVRGNGIGSRGA